MSWKIAITIYLIIWGLTQVIFKSIGDKLPRVKALSLMFFICALIMTGYTLIFRTFQYQETFLLISLAGFVNAYGSQCQLRAYSYSLSKTTLFIPFSGVITTVLAALFLGESSIYNLKLFLGMLLTFSAAFLLSKELIQGKRKEESIKIGWLLSVSGMVLIWGVTMYMVKFFSFSIPRSNFLLYWYIGAFLSSLLVLGLEGLKRKDKEKVFQKKVWQIPLASLGILGAMATNYWAFQLAPAGVVEPIRRFGMGFLPILIGWFVFKERKGLTKVQIFGFILGAIGTFLVVLGTY